MSVSPNSLAKFPRPRHRDSRKAHDRGARSIAGTAMWPDAADFARLVLANSDTTELAEAASPLKVLLVNAHPDDESESAAVVYRITHELAGIVDQVVVTNGEGGYRYAALAEAFYRLPLTNAIDRRELLGPIRREEVMRASRILGIRHSYFLDQTDTGVTSSAADGMEAWDIARIRQELRTLLEFEHYNLVLILLPTPDTHGHH